MQMIDDFALHIQQLPFNFYFDNLFTGINLLKEPKTWLGKYKHMLSCRLLTCDAQTML